MSFKKDFLWGAATASYQIEGAAFEDGKGASVWDMFSHEPGKVFQGHTGDVACDHYHKMKEDVALMRQLGIKNYRFSVSWPRVLPEGTGKVNEKGMKFYSDLVDELLANGIRPFVTLFHWDYPYELQKRGAWENPDSVLWYVNYVSVVARALGDRVKDFITFNEPQCFIGLGYGNGEHAPGLKLSRYATVPMTHNMLLSHGKAVQVLRAMVPGVRVSYAPCGNPCIPLTDSAADIDAARKAYFSVPDGNYWYWNVSWFSDPALLGTYPEEGLRKLGQFLPKGWEKDLEEIHQPLDYYCQNIYSGNVVRAGENGPEAVTLEPGHPKTAIQWNITPDCLYWGPKFLYERYQTPIVISENGMSAHDTVSLDGKVHDPNRQDYLNRYLLAFRRAAENGVDCAGYFVWSLMDNYEWAYGYSERFGIVHVDFETQKRIPKDSALWYKTVIEQNGENL